MKALLDAIHDVFVVVLQPYYPCSGGPNCLKVSQSKVCSRRDPILCAISKSSRGYPSKVVRLVVMLTPCLRD